MSSVETIENCEVRVQVGMVLLLRDLDSQEILRVRLVPYVASKFTFESLRNDNLPNLIDDGVINVSDKSLLGGALVGKKIGQVLRINAPAGQLSFQVIDIEVRP